MSQHKLSAAAWERAQQPRNYGPVFPCDGHARITGPCGDTMEIWVRIDQQRVVAIGFNTTGCGTSRAAGSMATELAMGQPLDIVSDIDQDDVLLALGGLPAASQHCALLAVDTLCAAIEDAVGAAPSSAAKVDSSR